MPAPVRKDYPFHWLNKIAVAPDREHLIVTNSFLPSNSTDSTYTSVALYRFDHATGTLSFQKLLYEKWGYSGYILSAAFSPNQHLVYAVETWADQEVWPTTGNQKVLLYQFDVEDDVEDSTWNRFVVNYPAASRPQVNDISLAPNGKIYLLNRVDSLSGVPLSVIHRPNEWGTACDLSLFSVNMPPQYRNFQNPFLPAFFYDRLYFNYQSHCNDTLIATLVRDSLFEEVTWYLEQHGQVVDSIENTDTLRLAGLESGHYFLKVRGRTATGSVQWNSDSLLYTRPPQALFTTEDTAGCQHIGFQFINQSVIDTIHPAHGLTWHWNFADGATDTTKDPLHTYTQSGTYPVQLIVSDGFCTDTFERAKEVEILAAPKPGFSTAFPEDCAPVTVAVEDQSVGIVSSYHWWVNDSLAATTQHPQITLNQPGQYWLRQELTSPTNCVTKDSVLLTVRPGIHPQEQVDMQYATVNDAQAVELHWEAHPVATSYHLWRGHQQPQEVIAQVSGTTFTDTKAAVSESAYTYAVVAEDDCGQQSQPGRIARTILLEGSTEGNDRHDLFWSPYADWPQGVLRYQVEEQGVEETFVQREELPATAGASSFVPSVALGRGAACYRITAFGYHYSSRSNVRCLPFDAVVYVPNSFSPNGDGINDTFRVSALALETFRLRIYNRWGELVYEGRTPLSGWDGRLNGRLAPASTYLWMLEGKDFSDNVVREQGTLELVR